MVETKFDAADLIAGFPLVKIKSLLSQVGLLPDRDDVAAASECLGCGKTQARRVLEEAERRGLVAHDPVSNRWKATDRGWELVFHWHPPRRMQPAIDYEDRRSVGGEVFETVPCSVLRSVDQEDMFEEAQFEVGVDLEYETNRLIALRVMQPDDYDDPDSSALEDTGLYLSIDDARSFVIGLEKAIDRAEKELAKRAARAARKVGREQQRPKPQPIRGAKRPSSSSEAPTASAPNPSSMVHSEAGTARPRGEKLKVSLQKLRATNRARRDKP